MPVYEYRCRACGASRDVLHAIDAVPPGECEGCGGELRRVFARVGVRFGSWGFTRTDSLVPDDRPRKDFKRLREKADEIADG